MSKVKQGIVIIALVILVALPFVFTARAMGIRPDCRTGGGISFCAIRHPGGGVSVQYTGGVTFWTWDQAGESTRIWPKQ